jgi:hypothetical protein
MSRGYEDDIPPASLLPLVLTANEYVMKFLTYLDQNS